MMEYDALEIGFVIAIVVFIMSGAISIVLHMLTWHDNSPLSGYLQTPERPRYIKPARRGRKLTRKEIKNIKRHMKED